MQQPCKTCGRLPHPVPEVRRLPPELQDIFPVIPPPGEGKPKRRRVVLTSRIITSEEWTQKLVCSVKYQYNISYFSLWSAIVLAHLIYISTQR